jgi:hypothetical protein
MKSKKVLVATTSTEVLAAGALTMNGALQNFSDETIYLSFDGDAATVNDWPLRAGAIMEIGLAFRSGTQKKITAIHSGTGTADLRVLYW